jgi:transcriptional regulator with XRE-family HTH domain
MAIGSPDILLHMEPMTATGAAESRVKEIRLARGMTGAGLARLSEIPAPTISKIELGQRGVTKATAPRLAKALGVPVASLYEPVGAPIPGAELGSAPQVAQPRLEIVEDAQEIAWLDLWRAMSERRRGQVLAALVRWARGGVSGH